MTWRARPIRPWRLPFGPDGRTYDPGLVVECLLFRDGIELATSPVWQMARLTHLARREIPRRLGRGWHVRRIGETDPCALVLWVMPHGIDGRAISVSPERVTLAYGQRLIVVTPNTIIAARDPEPRLAFMHLADVLVGTHPTRRRRAAPIPEDDLAALDALAVGCR